MAITPQLETDPSEHQSAWMTAQGDILMKPHANKANGGARTTERGLRRNRGTSLVGHVLIVPLGRFRLTARRRWIDEGDCVCKYREQGLEVPMVVHPQPMRGLWQGHTTYQFACRQL